MYTIFISNIYQFTSYFLFLKKQQVMEKLIGKTSWLITKKCDFSQPDSNDVVKVEYRWRKKLKNFLGKNILKQCSRLSHFETKMVLLKKWTINEYIINYSIKIGILITSSISKLIKIYVNQVKSRPLFINFLN